MFRAGRRLLWLLVPAVALFVSGCRLIIAWPTPLAVDPVGGRVYVVGEAGDAAVRVVDAKMGQTIARIPMKEHPAGVAVNPSNGELYVAAGESITIIDPSSYGAVATVPVGSPLRALLVNSTGTRLFALQESPDRITMVDTGVRRVVGMFPAQSPVAMAAPPGTDLLYLAQDLTESDDDMVVSTISLLDTETRTVIAATSVEGFVPLALVLNPSGTRLYAVGVASRGEESAVGRLLVLDTGSHRTVAGVPIGKFPVAVAVDAAGRHVYVVDYTAATLTVLATATNTIIATVVVENEPVAVATSASGREVYVSHNDGALTIVDARTYRVLAVNRP